MKVIYDEAQKKHYPGFFLTSGARAPNPERPERADILFDAARKAGLIHAEPPDFGLAPAASIHTPEYLEFLANIHARWQHIALASDEVIPNIHPDRRDGAYPLSAVGQAGYHMADTSCPIGPQTFAAALRSAHAATHAAHLVAAGTPAAYALCRPPGHHAFRDLAGGFCYLNNSAIAAQRLREGTARVAVLDVDLHHGNGTQGVFYERADVLTVSIHADPVRFYPFFWGHADERGDGAGRGYNLNLPLARKTGDEGFVDALDRALGRIAAFVPGALVVALGLDAFEGDPFGGLSVSTPGFRRIGERIGGIGLPTVIVQEGGYICDALGDNLIAFMDGFRSAHRVPTERSLGSEP
ncbi:acetoin utilization deacetylase AcuC-like enzyme [Angulomicrobium tetraedrale]|uniref:Acetoin utilization deacetylase AcuC-like enzyme n=1 Tax=Ancylobacter tetraedralis TaxID=217068 RepID=A0A839ZB81_9HYPH|nr:histone deacetylase family protein [Ancylobacter tetraedralis]MBB3771956.1 acetoin utilization deacetylase AcuC-like enzyme [Ancylobacter tetraedralis]